MGDNSEKKRTDEAVPAEIAVVDERTFRDKIYVVRGVELDIEKIDIK